MHLSIPIGTTSKIIQIPVFDSSSTVGAMLAGLVYNTVSLTAYYNREGAAGAATAITLVTATKGTWTSSGFVAVDGTNTPGWYELHIPDAALATGAKSVVVHLKGAANMVPVPIIIELTATSNQDAVRGGMTALPASGTLAVNPVLAATQTGVTIPTVTTLTNPVASVTGAVGSVTGNVGGSVASVTAGVTVTTNNDKTGYGLSAAAVQAVWDALTTALTTVGSIGKKLADWVIGTTQTGDSFARLGTPVGASVSADVAAIKADTAATLADTGTDGVVVAAASKTGYALSAAGVQAIWDALTTALTTVGSVGKKLADWVIGTAQTGDSFARIGAPAGASVSADVASVKADTGTNGVVVAAASKTGYALSAAGVDAILDDAPAAELSAVPTTTGTLRQMVQFLFQYFRNKRTVTATTETLFKEDATTSLGTSTVSDNGTTFTKGEAG